ncbi:hypothetical protein DEO72_LG8g2056 [Vigna unguiculata]|uniref:Uncharacterized protein n=1 Tax=Vigna unguiculata TaxID=3917 RepID=A0A4D6MTC6_VIGUN|nr:hypothetical protein DEO72_LG8g2056 [Vigna unguiculata]
MNAKTITRKQITITNITPSAFVFTNLHLNPSLAKNQRANPQFQSQTAHKPSHFSSSTWHKPKQKTKRRETPAGGLAAGESKPVDGGVWPRGVLKPGRVRSRERRRDGRAVTSRGALAHQRHRVSLDGDGETDDDLEVAEPAGDGVRQARPRGHGEDECSPGLERAREKGFRALQKKKKGCVAGVDGCCRRAPCGGAARQRRRWCADGRRRGQCVRMGRGDACG